MTNLHWFITQIWWSHTHKHSKWLFLNHVNWTITLVITIIIFITFDAIQLALHVEVEPL